MLFCCVFVVCLFFKFFLQRMLGVCEFWAIECCWTRRLPDPRFLCLSFPLDSLSFVVSSPKACVYSKLCSCCSTLLPRPLTFITITRVEKKGFRVTRCNSKSHPICCAGVVYMGWCNNFPILKLYMLSVGYSLYCDLWNPLQRDWPMLLSFSPLSSLFLFYEFIWSIQVSRIWSGQ